MKKALVVLLTGSMVLSLAACGSSDAETTATTEAAAEETTEAAEAAEETTEAAEETTQEEAGEETVDLSESAYLSDGVLTVGLNATFPPFEYIGEDGDPTGFDIAMMNEIGARLGVEVVIEDMDFDGIVAAIGTKIDCAATGMTITEERQEAVNFSDPYYNATQAVLLPVDSTIATAEDLAAAAAIGVQAGTTGETVAREINDAAVVSVKSFNQAVLDLVNGKDDAVVIDQVPGEAFLAQYPDELQLVDGSVFEFDAEEYGIAMPKDDEVMLNAINNALAEMKEDGTYDALVEEYISNYEAE